LLIAGADACHKRADGRPALVQASLGSPHSVRLLLEHRAAVNAADANGSTPLWFAGAYDQLETIRILLEHRADANQMDKQGDPPACAVFNSNAVRGEETLKLLVAHGADVTKSTAIGYSVEHRVRRKYGDTFLGELRDIAWRRCSKMEMAPRTSEPNSLERNGSSRDEMAQSLAALRHEVIWLRDENKDLQHEVGALLHENRSLHANVGEVVRDLQASQRELEAMKIDFKNLLIKAHRRMSLDQSPHSRSATSGFDIDHLRASGCNDSFEL